MDLLAMTCYNVSGKFRRNEYSGTSPEVLFFSARPRGSIANHTSGDARGVLFNSA